MGHEDVSRNVWKYGRWHHFVSYDPFKKNQPILKDNIELPDGNDNYGVSFIGNYGD